MASSVATNENPLSSLNRSLSHRSPSSRRTSSGRPRRHRPPRTTCAGVATALAGTRESPSHQWWATTTTLRWRRSWAAGARAWLATASGGRTRSGAACTAPRRRVTVSFSRTGGKPLCCEVRGASAGGVRCASSHRVRAREGGERPRGCEDAAEPAAGDEPRDLEAAVRDADVARERERELSLSLSLRRDERPRDLDGAVSNSELEFIHEGQGREFPHNYV